MSKNKAVYTRASVACGWAGAVMQKLLENATKNIFITDALFYAILVQTTMESNRGTATLLQGYAIDSSITYPRKESSFAHI